MYEATLWPNRSLTSAGFGWLLGISAVFLGAPLVATVGSAAFFGIFPFAAAALFFLWFGIRRNNRNLAITEQIWIWRDEMRVERTGPKGEIKRWQADPLRVRLHLHRDAKVEDYLTATGGGREIELGAFLSPEERQSLLDELEAALTKAIVGLRGT